MTPREEIVARGRAFDLLADLLAYGPRRHEHLARTSLAPHLPSDPDEGAAEHQRVFGREVPPFASVWFHPEGLVGGEVQDDMRTLMRDAGFEWRNEPDHVAEGLRLLAWLAGAEADAIEDDDASLERVRALTRRAHEALAWVPLLHATVIRLGSPLYEEALALVDALLPSTPCRALAIDPPKKPARRLAVPAACGMLWTYTALSRIARPLDLPAGMRSRFEILDNLFDESARFGVRRELEGALDAELAAFGALLPPSVEPFREKIARTRAALRESGG
jgi:TorA maturation chaperone TorD